MMATYSERVLQTEMAHLIGYWRLNESSGAVVADSSPQGNDAVANGITWGAAGIGDGATAASWDGVSDHVALQSAGLDAAFDGRTGTLLVWAKSAGWAGTYQYALRLRGSSSDEIRLWRRAENTVRMQYTAGGSEVYVDAPVDLSEWVCFAMTWNDAAGEVRCYVNGEPVGAPLTGFGEWTSTSLGASHTCLGASLVTGANAWWGALGHLALWDAVLTPTQIADLAIVSSGSGSSASTVWTVGVDWDRDGAFATPIDDVTERVMSARWFLGARKPYQDTADDSMLTLVLDNSDQQFSPENSSSPLAGKLTPFKPVRIQSDDGTTVCTHWIGWIESIQPAMSLYGERTVAITAAGPMQFYKAAETHLALQEHLRTDAIVAALIKEVVFPPALVGAWVLGRVGNSEVGVTTRLVSVTQYSELDEGITTLAMAADNWVQRGGSNDQEKDTFDVYRAIKDVVAAERGRFLFSRDGKALFWNRHRLIDDDTVLATFDNTMQNLTYQYAGLDDFKNEVVVVCHPRAVGVSDQEVLWKLEDEVRIAAGKSRTVTAKYQDGSDNRIGGKNVTVTDISFREGDGSIELAARANSAMLEIVNPGAADAILTSCAVRGQKITDFGQMEATARDAASIIDYGRRTMRLNLPSVDNFDDAESIALFELHRRSQPRGAVQTLSLRSHGTEGGGHHTHQLARTLGDKITIREDQTGHAASYYIIGEAHTLSAGATLFETTWHLEPAPLQYPWKLGVEGRSELSQTTVLTY